MPAMLVAGRATPNDKYSPCQRAVMKISTFPAASLLAVGIGDCRPVWLTTHYVTSTPFVATGSQQGTACGIIARTSTNCYAKAQTGHDA
jgi:hypothetical protein